MGEPNPDSSARLQDPSIVQEPLADLRSTLSCIPNCHFNSGAADLSHVIDPQREDTKDVVFAHTVPVLPIAKDKDLKEVAGTFGAADVVDFGNFAKERSRLAADRRYREFQEPAEPADVGVLDMLLQWTSKMGFGFSAN